MAAELLQDPSAQQELVAAAFIIAGYADMVGQTCRRVLREAVHVLQIIERRFALLTLKVETKTFSWHLSRVDGYLQACRRMRNAMRVLTILMDRAEFAGLKASSAASNTAEETMRLARLIRTEMDISEAASSVIDAVELTNNKMNLAKEGMYLVLKSMEECLVVADFEVTDSWMDTAGDFITPVTVGGCVFFTCMYRHLHKIKDPIYYSFLGVRIPAKLIIPGSIITCGILSAVHFMFGSSARVLRLEDDIRKRQERNEMLDKVRTDINDYHRWFSSSRHPIPSYEEAKNKIPGTEA